ncbi:MAG TPA: hypothetical protein VF202_07090 [Trueperaceae bacterium]
MLGLGIQVAAATVAALRGWGFLPFGLLVALFFLGRGLGPLGLTFLVMILDWVVIGVLIYLAVVGKPRPQGSPEAGAAPREPEPR